MATALALTLGSVRGVCFEVAADYYGPSGVHSMSPALVLRTAPLPQSPYILGGGRQALDAGYSFVSVWTDPTKTQYFFDFDLAETRLSYRRGIGEGWELGLAYVDRAFVNNHLDQPTINVHHFLNLDQTGRNQYPKNVNQIRIPQYGIDVFLGHRDISETAELSLARVLLDGGQERPQLSTSLLLGQPLDHNDLFEGRRGVDSSVGLQLAWPFARSRLYGNLAWTHFGTDRFLGVPLRAEQWSGYLGYEHVLVPKVTWIADLLVSQGVIDLYQLAEPSYEVHVGVQGTAWDVHWRVIFIENIIKYENSPDVGGSVGLTKLW